MLSIPCIKHVYSVIWTAWTWTMNKTLSIILLYIILYTHRNSALSMYAYRVQWSPPRSILNVRAGSGSIICLKKPTQSLWTNEAAFIECALYAHYYRAYVCCIYYVRPKMLLPIILMAQLSGTFKRNSINSVFLQSINLQKKFKAVKTMPQSIRRSKWMGMMQHCQIAIRK